MTTLNLRSRRSGRLFAKWLPLITGMMLVSALPDALEARESGQALKVQLTSGTAQYYMLASSPVITFENDKCMIKSDEFSTQYDIPDVAYAEIVDHTASADEHFATTLSVDLSDPSCAVIRGMESGSAVTLVNLSGINLSQTAADDNGTATVRLSELPKGIYIITSKETTFKIYKK